MDHKVLAFVQEKLGDLLRTSKQQISNRGHLKFQGLSQVDQPAVCRLQTRKITAKEARKTFLINLSPEN